MAPQRTDRSRQDLGRTNKRAVMGEIVMHGPISRTSIAANTGLTPASVSRITRDLIEAGLIRAHTDQAETGRPGRKFVELDVDPSGGYILGIGLNVFQQAVTLADLKNNRLDRRDLNLRNLTAPDIVVEHVIAAAKEMIGAHVTFENRLIGGCVAITGAVDPVTGTVRDAPYFGWRNVHLNLAERLSNALGPPFYVENLANSINLAEVRFGLARGARNTMLIHCALGLGASLYMDGRLIRGHDFGAGQVGNLQVGLTRGDSRTLDDISGGRGILSAMGDASSGVGSERADEIAARLMAVIEMANSGDPKASSIMENAGRTLGRSIAMFAGLSHPEMIMLSGPLPAVTPYMDACREAFEAHRPATGKMISLMPSDLSMQGAARWQAIGEFMVDRDIDLEKLKFGEAA